jgi:hypothetical protein
MAGTGKRYDEEQIIAIRKEAESAKTVGEVISQARREPAHVLPVEDAVCRHRGERGPAAECAGGREAGGTSIWTMEEIALLRGYPVRISVDNGTGVPQSRHRRLGLCASGDARLHSAGQANSERC